VLALRRIWTVLVGVWFGAFLARALLHWVLGLEGTWVRVAVLAAGLVSGILSIGEARGLSPMPPGERGATIIGWGAVVGALGAVACLALPFPWGLLAVVVVVVVTVVALSRVPAHP
jgi:hypothetical protein